MHDFHLAFSAMSVTFVAHQFFVLGPTTAILLFCPLSSLYCKCVMKYRCHKALLDIMKAEDQNGRKKKRESSANVS